MHLPDKIISDKLATTEKKPDQTVLPADFKLPDLKAVWENEEDNKVEMRVPLSYRGQDWTGRVIFLLDAVGKNSAFGQMSFEILNPDNLNERLSRFHSTFYDGNDAMERRYSDQRGSYCRVFYRNVEDKAFRRKGIGELSMRVIEELVRKINQDYPPIKMDKIFVTTGLGVLSRLLSGLGYEPHPADAAAAGYLLNKSSAELDDIDFAADKEVLFIKKLTV